VAKVLKITRSAIGIALMLISVSFLIQGGLSRYAQYGLPPHADWRIIAIGLTLLAAGAFLLHPNFFLRTTSK
jgi:hypothetical protein